MAGKLLFRLLLLAVLGLTLLGAASAVARPGLLPSQLDDYEGKFTPEQYGGRHGLRVALLAPCALLSVLATAALFGRWRGAPGLYFASAAATMVAVEFLRPYVHPGAGEDAYEATIVLNALVLALLFFGPARRWYVPAGRPSGAGTPPG
jgi:hypothetical protein